MFGIEATSSSAVRRPPERLEIVPPVASSRTRGRSAAAVAAAAWPDAGADGACASTDRTPTANVKRSAAEMRAGIDVAASGGRLRAHYT
jgi:hypothetical protein